MNKFSLIKRLTLITSILCSPLAALKIDSLWSKISTIQSKRCLIAASCFGTLGAAYYLYRKYTTQLARNTGSKQPTKITNKKNHSYNHSYNRVDAGYNADHEESDAEERYEDPGLYHWKDRHILCYQQQSRLFCQMFERACTEALNISKIFNEANIENLNQYNVLWLCATNPDLVASLASLHTIDEHLDQLYPIIASSMEAIEKNTPFSFQSFNINYYIKNRKNNERSLMDLEKGLLTVRSQNGKSFLINFRKKPYEISEKIHHK